MDTAKKELPLAYVPISPILPDAPATVLFKAHAGIPLDPNGHVYLVNLLLYTGVHAVHGRLGLLPPPVVAAVCRWPGDPDVLVGALAAAGFIYRDEAGDILITGWFEYGGGIALRRRERWREEKKLSRSKRSDELPMSAEASGDLRPDSATTVTGNSVPAIPPPAFFEPPSPPPNAPTPLWPGPVGSPPPPSLSELSFETPSITPAVVAATQPQTCGAEGTDLPPPPCPPARRAPQRTPVAGSKKS